MFKKIGSIFGAVALIISVGFASNAQALLFDQNVTSDVIFGSGNVNGAFTTDRNADFGIELGLRGKLRFNASNLPENTFNSNGAGTYSFDTGAPSPGFSFDLNNPQTAKWNFEWSINSDFNGFGGNLNTLTYLFEFDADPTAGTNFGTGIDLINVSQADHAIGTNATGNGAGTEAANPAEYTNLIANNNLAQNSVNYLFLLNPALSQTQLLGFNPNIPGIYTIRLSAFDGSDSQLASTSIDINVSPVPLPAALPLFGTGLAFMGFVGWRRRKVVTA